jgi:hypothetical protein
VISVAQAISSLRPNTEWTLDGEEIKNIIWHTPNVEPLTREEVEAEMQRLEEEQQNKINAENAARQAAIDHAKSLGFTDEMIAVMYPGLAGYN